MNADPIVSVADGDDLRRDQSPQVVASSDHSTPHELTRENAAAAAGSGADSQFEQSNFDDLFDGLLQPHADAPRPNAGPVSQPDTLASPPPAARHIPLRDFDDLPGEQPAATEAHARESWKQPEFEPVADVHGVQPSEFDSADLADFDADPVEPDAQAEPRQVSQPAAQMPVAPVHIAGKRAPSKQLVMGLLGVGAAAVLIVALLSARGAASPESAAAMSPAPAPSPRKQPGAAAATAQPRAANTPKWMSNPAAWAGGNRRMAAFELAGLNPVQAWMRRVHPVLVVRCHNKAIEAFVFTDSPAKMEPQDGDHTVRFRFDDQPESTERWPDSAEHDALFAPDAPAFVQRLVAARTLQFTFSPHNAPTAVVNFEVGGLSHHLTAAVRQCGWKNP